MRLSRKSSASRRRCWRCAPSTTTIPDCRTAASIAGGSRRPWPPSSGSLASPRGQAASRSTRAFFRALRPTRSSPPRCARIATATSPRASWCASRKSSSRFACSEGYSLLCPREKRGQRSKIRTRARAAWAGSRAGAAKFSSRSRWAPPARAGAGARGARKHRAGLSADQQVLQPVLLGRRPLMHKIVLRMVHAGIVTEPARAPDPALRALSQRLETLALERLGRALAVRHVDAGSCNGCELEIHALGNPYYNLEGLGMKFVASPRHADLLLVTGPVSRNMEQALLRTYAAGPEPKLVVAVGDCGCTGGIFGESDASRGRVSNVLPVDVAVPGCPPQPAAILQAILD